MNKYNWKGKKYPSEKDIQKKNQNNNRKKIRIIIY